MTGSASSVETITLPSFGKVVVAVEIKTVNARFFEVNCKLPSALSSLEVLIINRLQKTLYRGKTYFMLRIVEGGEALEDVIPCVATAQAYVMAAQKIATTCNLEGRVAVSDLFRMPDVFATLQKSLKEDDKRYLFENVDKAIDMLVKTRMAEGNELMKDLVAIFNNCKTNMVKISHAARELQVTLKAQVDVKIPQIEGGDELMKIQLNDLYVQLNKTDIHEEITRFNSHLLSVEKLLQALSPEKGRRFDFILQELLRETNTIMSKCSNFDISSCGVDIKVELEKAREQVQNIV